MVFSSIVFIFTFLPLVILAYYLAPVKLRNFVLLLASLIFLRLGRAGVSVFDALQHPV